MKFFDSDAGASNAVATRCPDGPSIQDILRADGEPVPATLALDTNRFLGDEDIPRERYSSEAYYNLEMTKLWPRTWQWACRLEHIPEPGDYYVYDVGYYSLIIVRESPTRIRAYHNSCLHRGTKLKPSGSVGSMRDIRCPYHGWAWKLDGTFEAPRCSWDFPHVHRSRFSLPEAQVSIWGGFVFINMDPNAKSLEQHLGVLPEHFDPFNFENRYVEIHIEKELPCNWKLAIEAFIENYHTAETHPQLARTGADENTQYDVFGDNVSRFIYPKGIPSPGARTPVSEKEMIDTMLRDKTSQGKGGISLAPGETARAHMADHLRRHLKATLGLDTDRLSTSELLDNPQYSLFPNMVLFRGFTFPPVYRFRPLNNRHDQTLFDILVLRPIPAGQTPPPPADPVRVKAEQSYSEVPGFGVEMAAIYDQDTSNLRLQQEGLNASRKPGLTLANYQESRIRHLHKTLEQWLRL